MSLINGDELHRMLTERYETWLRESKDPNIQKPEFVRGVTYGIKLAMQDLIFLNNRGKRDVIQ